MPENLSVDETYSLARRAAWAGDVDYCLSRLSELGRKTQRAVPGSPAALLRHAGEQRRARLKGRESPSEELILETPHLRGVVWQTGRREFELLAYLTDSSWEESFHRHARAAMKVAGVTVLDREEEGDEEEKRRGEPRQGELYPHDNVTRAAEVGEGPGFSWEETLDGLLCTGTVGDLGLIKVRGVWTGEQLPRHGKEIVARFRRIIDRIESPETVRSR